MTDERPIEVTVHGRIGSGPVDVRTLDAFCRMIRCVQDAIDAGHFDERRPAPDARDGGREGE